MEIPAPRSVSRDRVLDWLESIGLEPGHVRSLRLDAHEIRVEMYALDEKNRKQVVGDNPAVHTVCIPILEPVIYFDVARQGIA